MAPKHYFSSGQDFDGILYQLIAFQKKTQYILVLQSLKDDRKYVREDFFGGGADSNQSTHILPTIFQGR